MRARLTSVFLMQTIVLGTAFSAVAVTDEYGMRRDVLASARRMASAFKYMSEDKEKFADIFVRHTHTEAFRGFGATTHKQKRDVANKVIAAFENMLVQCNASSYIHEVSEVRSVFEHEDSTFSIIRSTVRFYKDGELLMTTEAMQLAERITSEWRFMNVTAEMLQRIRNTRPLFYKKMNAFQMRMYSADGTIVEEEKDGRMVATEKTLELLKAVLEKSKARNNSSTRSRAYKNEAYGFTIEFPVGWEIKGSNQKNTLVKAVHKDEHNRIALVAIAAYDIGMDGDIWELTGEDMFEKNFKAEYPNTDAILLDSGRTIINGKRALWTKIAVNDTLFGPMVSLSYHLVDNKILFRISGSADKDMSWFEDNESTFKESIESVCFDQ